METKSWKEIKDSVYGKKGTDRRDALDSDFESLKIRSLSRMIPKKKTEINKLGANPQGIN
ncbi:hypothetical protein [Subsaximicrobium wynnwilliamsii]|uniref:hypothetical protein n=1 Tax=Subsaximicrobium wynnwilliamsii TaxID=291179 RepID=UPI001CB88B9B|nr:hypothetical protein [Subsaximicrobium wynnwilliamsii]